MMPSCETWQHKVGDMRQNIMSYDNATVGSGNVVNDVQDVHNTFGQLVTEYQSHSGAVNVLSTPKINMPTRTARRTRFARRR